MNTQRIVASPAGIRPCGFSLRFLLAAITLLAVISVVRAQLNDVPPLPGPDPRYKVDVLLVVAHPDDETAIGSYLAKLVFDDHRHIGVVYCNRGTGGGNTIGLEQSTAMGLEREIEARRALALLGIADVWFLDGLDTPTQDVLQSLARWKHGVVLEELVRIVRLTRPEVIVSWLPHFVAGENHGDHQASGVIATEAFDMAGDPTVFPSQVAVPRERIDINQLNEGLHPWQAKKIYFFSDASHGVKAPGPAFDLRQVSPSKGIPYYRIAAALDTVHLTQGDVSAEAKKAIETNDYDPFIKTVERFHLIFGKSLVKCSPSGGLFDGIGAGSIAYRRPAGFRPDVRKGITLDLGGPFAFYRDFWRTHDIENIGPLVQPEMEIGVGSYVHIPLMIANNTADSVVVLLTADYPPGWKRASGDGRYHVGPHQIVAAQTFAFAPQESASEFQTIRWRAESNGTSVGSIAVRVKVSDWTLPQ